MYQPDRSGTDQFVRQMQNGAVKQRSSRIKGTNIAVLVPPEGGQHGCHPGHQQKHGQCFFHAGIGPAVAGRIPVIVAQ